MVKIINLKSARKAKARAEETAEGAVNRAAFGRSKAARQLDEARAEKARRDLDAHKKEDS